MLRVGEGVAVPSVALGGGFVVGWRSGGVEDCGWVVWRGDEESCRGVMWRVVEG